MDIRQLRAFVAAAEAGSISRAADRCRVAQPSLSQQIKRLERSLGVKLMDRLGRGVTLTDAGRALLPRARRILDEVRDARANLETDVRRGRIAVSVGAIPTMAPYLLPPAIEALRAELPELSLTVREGFTEDLVEALVNNELDCALMSTPVDHDLIDLEVIGHEQLVFVVPPQEAEEGAETVGAAEVRGRPTVTLEEMHCLGRQIQGFCSARSLSPRIVCRTTQLSTVLELVSLGMGVSLVPEMAVASGRHGCRVQRLKQNRPIRQIAAAWRRDRTRPHAALRFVEHVRANLGRGVHRCAQRGGAASR